jgi:hypothetical protein
MDLITTTEVMGNIGEFVGAIAVVATLGYLAVQVRQSREATLANTKVLRASIFESLNQTEIAFTDFYAEHAAELAGLRHFNEADGLTDEQEILAGAFASKCFRALETVYLHHKDGMLDEALLAARLKGFRYFCEGNPVVPDIWKRGVRSGGGGMSDDFIDFMENAMPSLLSDG